MVVKGEKKLTTYFPAHRSPLNCKLFCLSEKFGWCVYRPYMCTLSRPIAKLRIHRQSINTVSKERMKAIRFSNRVMHDKRFLIFIQKRVPLLQQNCQKCNYVLLFFFLAPFRKTQRKQEIFSNWCLK